MVGRQTAAHKAAWRTSVIGGGVNVVLVVIKGVGGHLAGSQALVADAVHSLVDLVTDIITFFAVRVGRADADESHPYGHGKFETFGTLLLSVFLALTALGLGLHVTEHVLANKLATKVDTFALWAAGVSVLLNEGLFRYCLYEGVKVHSKTIVANAWHHRADGLSSIAVFAGLLAEFFGFVYGDEVAAFFVVLFLLKIAYTLGRDAFDELVEAAIAPNEQERLTQIILQTPGVVNCHQFRARAVGVHIVVDAHIDVNPLISVSEGHHIAEVVEHHLKRAHKFITDVTIHIDPAHHHHAPTTAAKAPSREALEALVHSAIKTHCPAAHLQNLTLHFIKEEAYGDLVFTVFPSQQGNAETPLPIQGVQTCVSALKEALSAPNGPFAEVNILLKL